VGNHNRYPARFFSLLHCISHPSSLISLSKPSKPLLRCYLKLSMPTSFESQRCWTLFRQPGFLACCHHQGWRRLLAKSPLSAVPLAQSAV
jgi:hypothetical protein